MSDTPSIRRQVVDRVIAALESIDAKIPVNVSLEPDGTLVVRAALGGATQAAPRVVTPRGAEVTPRKRSGPAKQGDREKSTRPTKSATESLPAAGEYAERILAVLDREENHTGKNLVNLALALGMKKKSKTKLQADLDHLMASGKLKRVGTLYRRTDVPVRRGRKAASGQEAKPEMRELGRPTDKKDTPKARAAKNKKKRKPGRPPGKQNKPATPAQLAALAKAHAARRKKMASKRKATPAKKAEPKKKTKRAAKRTARAKATPTQRAVSLKKKAGKAAKKVSQKSLPERTDGAGQIPREETRRLPADGNEATPPSE